MPKEEFGATTANIAGALITKTGRLKLPGLL